MNFCHVWVLLKFEVFVVPLFDIDGVFFLVVLLMVPNDKPKFNEFFFRSESNGELREPTTPPPSQEHTNWLLRFFQSELFDASLAVHYLYRSKSKDTGVQQYLGKFMYITITKF